MVKEVKEISSLTPQEKIARLRELRERKLKELEEAEKKFKEELKETEKMLEESIGELKREEEELQKKDLIRSESEKEEREEKNLEELVGTSRKKNVEEEQMIYTKGSANVEEIKTSPNYLPLRDAITEAYSLEKKETDKMGEDDWRLYENLKTKLENMEKYKTTMSQRIADELDAFKEAFKNLQYRLQ